MKLGALFAVALTTICVLAFFHHLNHTYQNRIQQTTHQLQDQQAQRKRESDHQLQELQQKTLDQQKQIEDLKQQVTIRQQQKAAVLAASQAAQPVYTAQVASSGNCEAYAPLLAQYDWNTSIAQAVMKAESGCNPTASSPTCDHGLMQINCVHAAAVGGNLALLNDPATNIRVAYAVYSGAGWSAWTTYTSGAYLRYL